MYPKNFQQLIDHFASLPSIGPKMAERLVLFLYKKDEKSVSAFADALQALHDVKTCSTCFNIAEKTECGICLNSNREKNVLCIVEEPLDIIPFERSRSYNGLYHVLGGTVDGNKSDHLTIANLEKRIETESFDEIIIATNFTTEGDMTAFYLKRRLAEYSCKVSRLVRGLATGSDIEYADELTLKSALTNRTEMV